MVCGIVPNATVVKVCVIVISKHCCTVICEIVINTGVMVHDMVLFAVLW